MAVAVSGRVVFDRDRSATITAGDVGITSVPIILQDTISNVGAIVLTDGTGNFQFNNVPAGNYRLVEAWGAGGGIATPVDFSIFATTIGLPTPTDAPLSQVLLVTTVPAGSTGLSSLSPNTLFLTVAATTLVNQNFLDGPFRDIPLNFQNTVNLGPNLITTGGNGIFGTLPNGTAINNQANPNPYPGIAPPFTYVTSGIPGASQYTFVNIFTLFQPNWWNVTDHTTGMETGRLMLINGGAAGQTFFVDTIPVSQNTQYIFSTWMINIIHLTGAGLPRLGIEIRTLAGTLLYSAPLITIPEDITTMTWRQVGTVFNSGSNSSVVLRFLSQSSAAGGNDYAIDDVTLQSVTFNQLLTMSKYVDKLNAILNDTLNYTLVVKNSYTTDAINVRILDTIPNGTSFVLSSVQVNGTTLATADPGSSFTIPNIIGGSTSTITYKVTVTTIPSPNPIPNSGNVSYEFFAVPLQVTVPQSYNTNTVYTYVDLVALRSNKTASTSYVNVGDTYTYTIGLQLAGGITIANVKFFDTIPSGLTFVTNSFKFNAVTIVGGNPTPPTGVNLGTIASTALISTVTFQVTVVTKPNPNPIQNASFTSFNYTTNPANPNGASGNSPSNTTNSPTYMHVDLQSIKSADFSYIQPNTTITYTVLLKNNGTATATNIIFVDTIPTDTTFIANSFQVDGVTISNESPAPPTGIKVGTIPAGGQSAITFKVFAGSVVNGAQITNSSTSYYSYSIFPASAPSVYGSSNSNIPIINVVTLPIQVTIPNNATFSCTYTIDPSVPNTGSTSTNTNTPNNYLNFANLDITKATSNNFADLGYTVTYTVLLKNSGTTSANNVIFVDTVPPTLTFIANSLAVDGSIVAGTPNPPGINLGIIGSGITKTITFAVLVTTIPTPNPFINNANSRFFYTIDPSNPNTGSGSDNSNTVTTQVNHGELITSKSSTPIYVDCGTTITYTVTLKNTGNITLNNVIFSDTIPSQTQFINNSFTVNGITIPGQNPSLGVNVGDISPGATSTVTFKVSVVCS